LTERAKQILRARARWARKDGGQITVAMQTQTAEKMQTALAALISCAVQPHLSGISDDASNAIN
jgi:hypothetical protein